jgi:hypothetical protein
MMIAMRVERVGVPHAACCCIGSAIASGCAIRVSRLGWATPSVMVQVAVMPTAGTIGGAAHIS